MNNRFNQRDRQSYPQRIEPQNCQPSGLSERKQIQGTLIIPWKGRILTPTYNQLRKHEGNLNSIERALGSRSPQWHERNYKSIKIYWRGETLQPQPKQLLDTKGDLNELRKVLSKPQYSQPGNFQGQYQPTQTKNQRNNGSRF